MNNNEQKLNSTSSLPIWGRAGVGLLSHYLKIAFRNMWKYKSQTLISVIGLAVGFTFFALGYYWMKYETSYDGFYPDSKHIYRIYGIDKQSGRMLERLPFVFLEKLKQEFPEVEKATATYPRYSSSVNWEEKVLGYVDFTYVDEHFLEFFPPKIIYGKTERLLFTTEETVVTEKFARKYWGSLEDALGKVLKDGYDQMLTIVAVMENPPENSNFQQEAYRADVMGRRFFQQNAPDKQWALMDVGILVLLNENVNVSTFRKKVRNYAIDNNFNENLEFHAIPITEMRHSLNSGLSFNITYIRTFAGAGLLLLFCAIFNFLNLYVNRMMQRTREIKLRKTVGANHFSIINQLQTEFAVQFALVFVISSLLLKWAIPIFEQRFETQIISTVLGGQFFIITIVGFAILFLSCLFAEIRFSRFSSLSPTVIRFNNRLFRDTSICLQLAICIFFLMTAFIFFRQVSFMNHFDWGFKKDGLIRITMTHRDRPLIVKNIKQLAIVQEFIPSAVFSIKTEPRGWQGEIKWMDKPLGFNPIIEIEEVGKNFINGFGIPMMKGRFFEEQDIVSGENSWGGISLSSNKAVVNQEMEKIVGKDNIIGEIIEIPAGWVAADGTIGMKTLEIIGVIKNFHTLSLQKPVYPLILQFTTDESWGYFNYVRVAKGTENQAIDAIREVFKNCSSPGDPEEVEITSLQQLLDDFSKSEKASLLLFSVLATLCIIISIFGIYSISSSNMERRKKEIAIRKVCGATAEEIVMMFIKEYSIILFIANLIALPPALHLMNRWLTQYANHTNIHIWMVLLVIIFAFVVVISTVYVQVIEAANRNPAEVVKSE